MALGVSAGRSGGGLDTLGLAAGRGGSEPGSGAEVGAGFSVVGGGLWAAERQPEREPDEGDQERQGQQDVGPDNGTHFMPSLEGRRAGGTQASSAHGRAGGAPDDGAGGTGGGPGVAPRARRVSPPGHRNGAWGALCGVRPGGCGVPQPETDRRCLMAVAPRIFSGFDRSEITGRDSHAGWRGFWDSYEPVVTLGPLS